MSCRWVVLISDVGFGSSEKMRAKYENLTQLKHFGGFKVFLFWFGFLCFYFFLIKIDILGTILMEILFPS